MRSACYVCSALQLTGGWCPMPCAPTLQPTTFLLQCEQPLRAGTIPPCRHLQRQAGGREPHLLVRSQHRHVPGWVMCGERSPALLSGSAPQHPRQPHALHCAAGLYFNCGLAGPFLQNGTAVVDSNTAKALLTAVLKG